MNVENGVNKVRKNNARPLKWGTATLHTLTIAFHFTPRRPALTGLGAVKKFETVLKVS